MNKVEKVNSNITQVLKDYTEKGKCEICGQMKDICPVRFLKTTWIDGKKIEYPPVEKKLCKDCAPLLKG